MFCIIHITFILAPTFAILTQKLQVKSFYFLDHLNRSTSMQYPS